MHGGAQTRYAAAALARVRANAAAGAASALGLGAWAVEIPRALAVHAAHVRRLGEQPRWFERGRGELRRRLDDERNAAMLDGAERTFGGVVSVVSTGHAGETARMASDAEAHPHGGPGRSPAHRRTAELYLEGRTYREIAEELGISAAAVAGRLHQLRAAGEALPLRKAAPWSMDEEREIVERLGGRASLEATAQHVGRKVTAVDARARRLIEQGEAPADLLGAPRTRSWSAAEDRALIDDFGEGLTYAQIAERLSCDPSVVAERIAALRDRGVELEPRKPRWTAADKARLARRRAEGASYAQLSREFGRSHGTISWQLRSLRERLSDAA